MYFQQIAFVAAFVQTDASLRELDEVVLRILQLKHVHVRLLVDGACVEQKLMGRDGEQRLRHLSHTLLVEVLKVLGGQHHCRLLLTDSLEGVSDVLNGSRIVQPDIELVQSCHSVADRQKLIRHVREYVEQHGVPHILCRIDQSLHTEHKETRRSDIGVSVEELGVSALAHGVQTQQDLLQHLLCVKQMLTGIVVFVLTLD